MSKQLVVYKPKKKGNKRKQLAVNPAPTALKYRGPLRLPRGLQEDDTMTTEMNVINAVASGGTGVINTVFDFVNQVQAATDWASFAAIYNEYRVLSGKVHLTPWNPFNQNLAVTTVWPPLYSVTDRADNSSVASLSVVSGYDSVQVHRPGDTVTRSLKMDSGEEASWTVTSSTPAAGSRMYIKLFMTGATASTTYYDYLNSYMVQFRGRK